MLERELVESAFAAATRIHERLSKAGVGAPAMDAGYRERFYRRHHRVLEGKLRLCARHVIRAVSGSPKPLDRVRFLDHGGGLGFMGLVAKELGLGTVLYNDIDPLFLDAAQGIAMIAGVAADEYIVGDVEDLVPALGNVPLDAMVSYDVIEHIYNLDTFLEAFCSAPCRPERFFLSSGANMYNPRYLRFVIPVQRGRELLNSAKRIQIIRDTGSGLTEEQIVLLTRKTRMLIRNEIESVVERYLATGQVQLPRKTGANAHDPFGTNTVDPESGWWAEHLIRPSYFRGVFAKFGYRTRIWPGYYEGRGSFVNPILRVLGGTAGLPIAAYYSVDAQRMSSPTIEHRP